MTLWNPDKPRWWVKAAHNGVGLTSAVFLVLLALTGVLMNHPAWVAGSGGQPLCVAADPATPGRVYRGTVSALERSDDGGRAWREVPMLYPAQEVVAVSFRPGSPREIYALQRWQGPLVSRDGGAVWEPVPLDFDPQDAGVELTGLTVGTAGELYLESSAGLLRRPAGGAWESLDFDPARKNWTRLIRTLHSGHFFGEWFVKVYDAAALALVFLIVTGVVLWRVKSSS